MGIEGGGSVEKEPTIEIKEGGNKEIIPESKVGLFFGACIADIIAGKVTEEEIKEIRIRAEGKPKEWEEEVIEQHQKSYWRDNPEKGKEIYRRLSDAGKISQYRVGENDHNINNGHWLEIDQEEE